MLFHRLLRELTVERCCKLCFYLKEYSPASGRPTAPNQVMVDVLWISRKYSNYDASILHIYVMFICIYFNPETCKKRESLKTYKSYVSLKYKIGYGAIFKVSSYI